MTEELQIKRRILELKADKKALILCHNYQRIEVQKVSDHVGDSLELCMAAARAEDFEEIVFCGVDFMAESAAVLNPGKKVLVPSRNAVCEMAAMLGAESVRRARREYPGAAVVLYVNSLAEAKAEADILCTSANAVRIVSALEEREILFGPDRNLGLYVARKVPGKRIVHLPADGCCYVHKMIRPDHVLKARQAHPTAEVMVHPECDPDVVDLADSVLSTGGMVEEARKSGKEEFVVGTETTMAQTLGYKFPSKRFYPILDTAHCRGMQEVTLKRVAESLENDAYEVAVAPDVAREVRRATKRMLEVSGG